MAKINLRSKKPDNDAENLAAVLKFYQQFWNFDSNPGILTKLLQFK
ncbi:MAG: hypothetical protein PHP62_05685 [Candidatus Moranbacteria bacterium]|nr:hypothetical protein [Candidatus Moranbacteria bacterium]